MALSQVQVFNLALTKLGQDRAVSPDDEAEAVRVLRAIWDVTVDTVLADHPWKFAIKRESLAALATAPVGTTWGRQFRLPEPCLRLVQVGEDWVWYAAENQASLTFELEGGVILTNEAAPLFVRYVERKSNTGEWPPLFARSVAMRLAADSAIKVTQSNAREQSAQQEYEATVRMAKRQSAIERPPQPVDFSSWLDARGN